jgi:glutamyl/glutaminyl-tRNA synthetase
VIPFGPRDAGPVRPDPARIHAGPTTRFAPAPTGYLHLGHLVNAIYVWGVARATGGRVLLRVEDHDRQRCRPAYEAALLDDLERLGLQPDWPSPAELRAGPSAYRQSDDDAPYREAIERLRADGLVYACDCSRATFAAWAKARGHRYRGIGCPGRCRVRQVRDGAGTGLRVVLGPGHEPWDDLLLGWGSGAAASDGDLLIRDRHGNWTYNLCVVVDDARHGVDLVIRGRDLLDATPRQIRLGRLLGRAEPPAFLHHPLLRKPSGAKLSKADHDTSIRDLLAAGHAPADLLGFAAAAVGLLETSRPIRPGELGDLLGRGRPASPILSG